MSPIFRWSGAKRETKRPILGGDDPAYYLNGERVGEDPAELCNKVSVEICGDQFRVLCSFILWIYCGPLRCYSHVTWPASTLHPKQERAQRDWLGISTATTSGSVLYQKFFLLLHVELAARHYVQNVLDSWRIKRHFLESRSVRFLICYSTQRYMVLTVAWARSL